MLIPGEGECFFPLLPHQIFDLAGTPSGMLREGGRPVRTANVVALLVVGVGILLAACAGTEPRIQRIVPSQNATAVATDTVIEIGFDRLVDRASVESRVQVEPSLPGCPPPAGACRMTWAERTLRIQPDLNLQPSTKYTVRLLAGFTDAHGQPNRLDHSWSFVTEAPPSVTGLEPAPQSVRVSPVRDLVLTFSRAMQPQSVEEAVRLTPPTRVRVVQNPSNHAQFQIAPLRPLQPRAEYTVEVSFAARDAHGNGMAGTLRSTFTTGDMSFPAMVGYLASTTDTGPRTTVGLVDPHPNPVAGRPLPKVLYQEPATGGATLQDFWWLPEGRGLLLLRRLPSGEVALFTYNISSGTMRDLGVTADAAALSPDGTRVAYTRGGELHLRTLADGRDRLLASEGSITGSPAFSPDGRTLVYVAVAVGPARVYLLNVDLGSRFRIPGVDDPTDQPAWAPDGDKLLFKRQRAGKASLWLFFLANPAGAELRRVADLDLEQPTWLDTTTVVGVLRQQGRPVVVVRVNVFSATDGEGGRPLTRPDTVSSGDQPSVPPYDRRVAFTSEVRGQPQIWVMNADGSAPLQLTYAEAGLVASKPKWTPRT